MISKEVDWTLGLIHHNQGEKSGWQREGRAVLGKRLWLVSRNSRIPEAGKVTKITLQNDPEDKKTVFKEKLSPNSSIRH